MTFINTINLLILFSLDSSVERQHLVARWQIFTATIVHNIMKLTRVDIPNPPLKPNVKPVVPSSEKSRGKAKKQRSLQMEEVKGINRQKGESQIEYDKRIIREYLYKQTKYDLSEIYKLTATDDDRHLQLANKIEVVEGLFNKKQIVLRGFTLPEKKDVVMMIKVGTNLFIPLYF